ncbi:Ger(x)C family spore germination protein [Bacillus subtilis]|uniref:Ger(x)C family spore germination protein n=1 Tax=Lederbergia ruris TaxID=217495 RepID=UPI002029E75D
MIRKMMVLSALLFAVILLSGCWDKKELTDIAFVAAFGVDKGENGGYIGTFQIINPGNVAGGLQGGSGQNYATVTVYEVYGNNLTEVSRRAANEISRVLFYSHANLVVIGEELAKEEGVAGFMDAFDRDDRFRDTAKVVIAKDTSANNLLKITTPIDKIPANKIIKTLQFSKQQWGEQWPVSIRELINVLVADGKEAILPSFRYSGSVQDGQSVKNLESMAPNAVLSADDMAIFKNDKLIGFFHEKEALGAAWIMNHIDESTIGINWGEKKEAISFQIIKEKTKVAVRMQDGKPSVTIDITTKGELGEVGVPINIEDRQIREKITKKVENKIKQMVHSPIERTKELQTDVFGFGEKLYKEHPEAWKKIKNDWNDQYYPELDVNVTVNASITRTGLRTNPFTFEQ